MLALLCDAGHGWAIASQLTPDADLGGVWTMGRPLSTGRSRSWSSEADRRPPVTPGVRGPTAPSSRRRRGPRCADALAQRTRRPRADVRSLLLLKLVFADRSRGHAPDARAQHDANAASVRRTRATMERSDGTEWILLAVPRRVNGACCASSRACSRPRASRPKPRISSPWRNVRLSRRDRAARPIRRPSSTNRAPLSACLASLTGTASRPRWTTTCSSKDARPDCSGKKEERRPPRIRDRLMHGGPPAGSCLSQASPAIAGNAGRGCYSSSAELSRAAPMIARSAWQQEGQTRRGRSRERVGRRSSRQTATEGA